MEYYLDYIDNGKIVNIQIPKDTYSNCVNYKSYTKKWSIKGVDYDILKCYKKEIEEVEKVEIKQQIEPKKPLTIEVDNNSSISFSFIFVLIILIYYIYYNFKKLGQPIKEEPTPIKSIIKENIVEKVEILDYQSLENERVEIYKILKSNNKLEKETKKVLYSQIRELKEKIKCKDNVKELSNLLQDIKQRVYCE